MPSPAYLTIIGASQGLITKDAFSPESVGNVFQAPHRDEILVQAFKQRVSTPRDPQSGQPTGQRVHDVFEIIKVVDKASPLLMSAASTGEKLTRCELKVYRTSASGQQEHYLSYTLEDAIIVDFRTEMADARNTETSHLLPQDVLQLSYRKITLAHIAGGTETSDDWRAPPAV